jgi:hypothetical protein
MHAAIESKNSPTPQLIVNSDFRAVLLITIVIKSQIYDFFLFVIKMEMLMYFNFNRLLPIKGIITKKSRA